ncbi:unnamed protein product [Polarella glacialis]|uniref:Catechol O-methyltransferase n=1 Tax=Polarella glacialis TaxID=89957 RepID=A0A813DYN5_POLGL|nr:unnamed protein product [Polarella glacialis]
MSPVKLRQSALLLVLVSASLIAAGQNAQDLEPALGSCRGSGTVAMDTWQAAVRLADEGVAAELGVEGGASWLDWSRTWLPLGKQVLMDLEENLRNCPEGAMVALAHSLPALDEEQGDAGSLELVKMLHHLMSDSRKSFARALEQSEFQRHWLLAMTSLTRFAYLKWVQVPQDSDLPASSVLQANSVATPQFRKHHAFLFRSFLDRFVASGVYDMEVTENSVLFSEAFAFTAFCHLHEVDLVLESGVYKGVSTEIWSLFAKDVAAVDIFIPPEAEKRLQQRPNVQLEVGDGRTVLPMLLEQHAGRRAAVFIDGPKGELAIRLALSLVEHPQVAFVAMHDMEPYRGELQRLGACFFSDEAWFQAAYGHLDEPFRQRPDLEAGGTMAFLPSKSQQQLNGIS